MHTETSTTNKNHWLKKQIIKLCSHISMMAATSILNTLPYRL